MSIFEYGEEKETAAKLTKQFGFTENEAKALVAEHWNR